MGRLYATCVDNLAANWLSQSKNQIMISNYTSVRIVDRMMNMTSYQDFQENVNRTIIRHVRTVNVTTMDLGSSHSADPLWFRNHQETSQWKMFLDSLSADYLFVYSISMLLGLLAGALFTVIVVDKCILKTNYFCNCLNRRDRVQSRVATAPLVAWQTV